ncbi:MAG TPA: TIGR02281 family clan AA aspartic protease [Xanthobacteraceae bacterium]
MRRLLLWALLGAVLIALVLIVARRGDDAAGLSGADLASLAQKIVVLVIAGAVALMLFRERFAQALTAALFWVALALILVVGYSYRFELHDAADRMMAELAPGHAATTAGRTVQVARAANGDFAVNTQVNGARVSMVLDTGASSVVLTREDAKAAGLPLEVLNYTVSIDTANGRTLAAPVTLDRLGIGGLVEHSIAALVAQPGQLKVSLLGMSFLNRLQSWEVRGDRLLLHAYP